MPRAVAESGPDPDALHVVVAERGDEPTVSGQAAGAEQGLRPAPPASGT